MAERPSVCLAFSGSFCGGAEALMLDVLALLKRESYEIEVFLNGKGEVSELLSAEGQEYTLVNIDDYASFRWPFPFFKRIFELLSLLRTRQPAVCLVEGKVLTQLFAVAGKFSGVKVISYVHFPPSAWEVSRVLYRCCDRVLFCCEGLFKYFAGSSLEKGKLVAVRNYVDSTKFRAKPADIGNSKTLKLLLVGHLSKVKGQVQTVEVLGSLVEQGYDLELLLAGADNSADGVYEKTIRAKVKHLGLGERVRFLGKCSEMTQLYHSADIFVLPSLKEGLPLVVLEAMACALPVVASSVDGTPEAVVDGETGFLISVKDQACDLSELEARLKQLIDSPSLRVEMGRQGRERVENTFDKSAWEQGILSTIQTEMRGA